MKKQTAGRDALGSFAPKFAELNDDVLFGQRLHWQKKYTLNNEGVALYGEKRTGECIGFCTGR